jgi:hypothetical protein
LRWQIYTTYDIIKSKILFLYTLPVIKFRTAYLPALYRRNIFNVLHHLAVASPFSLNIA